MEETVMSAPVLPETIRNELYELWLTLGHQSDPEASAGVLRACAMTLIVISGDNDDSGEIGDTLAELMRDHPSRAVVLRLVSGAKTPIAARVFAQCRLPVGQRRQICCEQIEITADAGELPEVAAVVLGVTAPDLPVVVWCRSIGLLESPGFQALAGLADKVIVDSSTQLSPVRVLGKLLALRGEHRLVSDLAWTRLTPWREAIAQVFAMPDCEVRRARISRFRIRHGGQAAPAGAYYMAAWLAGSLGWEHAEGDFAIEAAGLAGPNDLTGVELSSPGLTSSVQLASDAGLHVRVNGLEHRTVFPVMNDAAAVGEELSIAGRDSVYDRALARTPELASRW
jgi:glucose-6-phosphate dehydrogenase assembly protein OpcA